MLISTEEQEVLSLRDEENLTFIEIADKLGFSERTARRRYENAVLKRAAGFLGDETDDLAPLEPGAYTVEVPADKIYLDEDRHAIDRFKPMEVVGDALVTSDWHIPLHDPTMVNHLIKIARDKDIKTLIINGDYWHMDTFSSYLPLQPEAAWPQERKDGNEIMRIILKTFDEVYFIVGNHDYRLTKTQGYKHSFTECMKWAFSALTEEEMAKIYFSDLDYLYYYPGMYEDNGTDLPIRVCHPTSFSDIPLVIPKSLAIKYGCSVITGHSHHLALGVAPDGYSLIMESGGLYHKARTEYIQRSNKNHEWVQGFILFKEGRPTLYSPLLGNL